MSITKYTDLAEKVNLRVDTSKIVRHQLTPSSIEIDLVKSDNPGERKSIGVKLFFQELRKEGRREMLRFTETQINLGEVSEDIAKEIYSNYSEKIKKGEYLLHRFDDGSLEVELT